MTMATLEVPVRIPSAGWQRAVPLLLVLAALLWLFRETALAMASIWSRSDTFAHAFLVPPISLWLISRKRAELARALVAPSPLWLLPLLGACVVWLLAQLAGVHAAAQSALVAMIVFAVPAVLGQAAARVIAFPLLFLFFCVPVGDFLIEPMMDGTAEFTIAALRLSGIPVYREGLMFVIPSGNWSVVSACSGVRYLIASLMVGTLFAYLNFHSLKRRLLFVALAIVVPVLANWLRAYMIVMLGHLSSNKLAAGADHLIYGWIFFGVVILLMFMIGARFVDAPPATAAQVAPDAATLAQGAPGTWVAALTVALLLLATQGAFAWVDRPGSRAAPALALPAQLGGSGPTAWVAGPAPATSWTPAYRNAAAVAAATYRAGDGRDSEAPTVGVWVGLFRDQGYERKMITSTNQLVEETASDWLALSQPAVQVEPSAGGALALRAYVLRTPADPKVNPMQRLLVWRVYRVAGRFVAGDAPAMLWLALQRLAGGGDDSAVLMIYTPIDEDAQPGAERLQRFVTAHLAELAARVDATAAPVR